MGSFTATTAALAVFAALAGCAMAPGLSGIRPVGGAAVGQTSVAAGNELVARGQYGLAIAAYRRVLRQDPANSRAIEGLAISYELLGRLDLSDRYYQEALALAPRNPRIYQNFAASLRAQGRHREAEQLMADLRIALPDAPVEAAAVVTPIIQPAPVQPAPVAAAAAPEPDIRTIRQSERSTLVVTMPRQPAAVASKRPAMASGLPVPAAGVVRPARVVNAVGRHGIARQTAALLAKRGIGGLETGDAAFKLKRSRILVPREARGLGERLARNLPFAARIEESARVDRVQLLVGEDALPALRGRGRS
ncbi:tetratricopeptide repeat protein [Sphingomonas sp. MS122]|uniref:LytR C-terminal domain-containing protein n=1 Tax=Sphingomonas sp. MS122 TaxID=3412683 RepID=UPI003C2C53C5